MQNILRENKSEITAVHSNENRNALNWTCVLQRVHANAISTPILCMAEIEKSTRSIKLCLSSSTSEEAKLAANVKLYTPQHLFHT